jgi:hypothetical protein
MSIKQSIMAITSFQGDSLTESLADIERSIVGSDASKSRIFCDDRNIDQEFMASALAIKDVAGQINVIIHAAGILQSLSTLLDDGEIVESVSLGAGNTGRKFDLETNYRVAEFKFIDWKGGAESIRQNGVFKDFYELAEYETEKKKMLYVVGTTYPLKFFKGSRALTSVLSKQSEILSYINNKYDNQITVVREYYELHRNNVSINDIRPHIGRSV